MLRPEVMRAECTISSLYVDGVWECYILEDTFRGDGSKVNGATAIPAGLYPVIIDMSTRFKRLMPRVLDVPGFTGIRIHPGNVAVDTEGCLLPGRLKGVTSVSESRLAYVALFEKLQDALRNEEKVFLRIWRDFRHVKGV